MLLSLKDEMSKGFERIEKKGSKSLKSVDKDAKKATGSIGGMSKGVAKLAGSFAILATAKKSFDMIKGINVSKDAMLNFSNATGVAVKDLSALEYSAQLNKTSFASLQSGLKKMSMTISQAELGSLNARKAFSELGVAIKDDNGELRNLNDIFMDVSDSLKGTENDTERLTKAQAVFGRNAVEMSTLLQQGSTELRKQAEEAENLGIVFDRVSAEKSANFNDNLLKLTSTFKGIAMEVTEVFTPALTASFETIAESVVFWREAMAGISNEKLEIANSLSKEQVSSLNDAILATKQLHRLSQDERKAKFATIQATTTQLGLQDKSIEDLKMIRDLALQRLKAERATSNLKPAKGSVDDLSPMGGAKKAVDEWKAIDKEVGAYKVAKNKKHKDDALKMADELAKEELRLKIKGIEDRKEYDDSMEQGEIDRNQRLLDDKMEKALIQNDFEDKMHEQKKERALAEMEMNRIAVNSSLDTGRSLIASAKMGLNAQIENAKRLQRINTMMILMDGAVASGKVWAGDAPWPVKIGQQIQVAGQTTAQVATVQAQKFALGGVVDGNSTTGDKVPAMVNSKEMIMNQGQQSKLWDFINGGSKGGQGVTINLNDSVIGENSFVQKVINATQMANQTAQPAW